MARVILVSPHEKDSMVGELLNDNLTDEQARELANAYNLNHLGDKSKFAKIVLDSDRSKRRHVAFM